MSRLHIAFFTSGNGSLFESLVTRCRTGEINAEPVIMICSNPRALALDRARKLDVPAVVIRRRQFDSVEAFSDALTEELVRRGADFVCLAGYLEMVPAVLVRRFRNRMLNIHPALLPGFGGAGMYGHHVHEAVIHSGARISGATVHLVDEEYDHGPIVVQRAIFVLPDDTADSLAERVHRIEFDLYADAVKLFAQDRVEVNERRVKILPEMRHD